MYAIGFETKYPFLKDCKLEQRKFRLPGEDRKKIRGFWGRKGNLYWFWGGNG